MTILQCKFLKNKNWYNYNYIVKKQKNIIKTNTVILKYFF